MVRINKKISTKNGYPAVYVASRKRVQHDRLKQLIGRLDEFGLGTSQAIKIARNKDSMKVVDLCRTFDEMVVRGATPKELKAFLTEHIAQI
jgi:hypothetical protein